MGMATAQETGGRNHHRGHEMKRTKRLVAVGWALALAVVLAGCAPAVGGER